MPYRIRLAKEDFKFSSAHFTLFPDGGAERLHGHNYQVAVELSGESLDEVGLLVDVAAIKERIRKLCARLDERVLLPGASPRLRVREQGAELSVELGDRSYRFPSREAALLPVTNVSCELLARLAWDELAPELRGSRVTQLTVEVSETSGQSALYSDAL